MKVYITGHKNPDMDSICSAWCYGVLKNQLDKSRNYVPIRCGNLNNQTKWVFERLKLEPPRLVKDISPRVHDVARHNILCLDENEPILRAIKELDERTISVIPVFNGDNVFQGILSLHEITQILLGSGRERPSYQFRINNFAKVLPGFFYRRGKVQDFNAHLMTGVMPLEISVERIDQLGGAKPLLVMGLREDLLEYAVTNQFPGIIITGMTDDTPIPVDLSSYEGTIYVSQTDTAETTRLLRLSTPLKNIINRQPVRIESDMSFDEARDLLLQSRDRGLPVFTGDTFDGVITRRCFIEKPRPKLILMDHNEISQSVNGADQADIIEIHDHHRLGTIKTKEPIYCNSRPVGSTCTIVYELFITQGITPDKTTATLLLSGILSDTLILKSPTTTDAERRAVESLAELAGVDYQSYGEQMFSNGLTLTGQKPSKLIFTDYKEYSEGSIKVGIGQLEVLNLNEVDQVKESLVTCLKEQLAKRHCQWIMLLITDVTKGDSVLLSSDFSEAEDVLIYEKEEDNLYKLPGIVSRKKQLLPEILRVLEELSK